MLDFLWDLNLVTESELRNLEPHKKPICEPAIILGHRGTVHGHHGDETHGSVLQDQLPEAELQPVGCQGRAQPSRHQGGRGRLGGGGARETASLSGRLHLLTSANDTVFQRRRCQNATVQPKVRANSNIIYSIPSEHCI